MDTNTALAIEEIVKTKLDELARELNLEVEFLDLGVCHAGETLRLRAKSAHDLANMRLDVG